MDSLPDLPDLVTRQSPWYQSCMALPAWLTVRPIKAANSVAFGGVHARGLLAVGGVNAVGLVAIGGVNAIGIVAVGGVNAIGIVAVGGVHATGLVAVGGVRATWGNHPHAPESAGASPRFLMQQAPEVRPPAPPRRLTRPAARDHHRGPARAAGSDRRERR